MAMSIIIKVLVTIVMIKLDTNSKISKENKIVIFSNDMNLIGSVVCSKIWRTRKIHRLSIRACQYRYFISYIGQLPVFTSLSHWGRVTHICVSKIFIIGSDKGLSPGRRRAIIWTNAGVLLIGTLGTNFSDILIETHIFSFMKMRLKMSSGIRRPFCLGLNVLRPWSNRRHNKTVLNNVLPSTDKLITTFDKRFLYPVINMGNYPFIAISSHVFKLCYLWHLYIHRMIFGEFRTSYPSNELADMCLFNIP